MFQLDELHPIYQSVDHDVAVIIANLGATAYCSSRDTLHEHWTKAISEEDNIKMEKWKAVGYGNAVEEYRERLQEADAVKAKLVEVSGELAKMNASIEDIAQSRIASVIDGVRKECEYAKIQELAELREQLAITSMQKQLLDALQFKLQTLEEQRDALQERLLEQTVAATKSSHAIGKKGEASIFEMMEAYVVPQLPYAEIRNVSTKSHVGDIHIWVNTQSGKRVKFMIDVKNYSSPVQKREIEKLISNVETDDAAAAIMLSINTYIQTKQQFQIERSSNGKPCMFISLEGITDNLKHEVLCWALRTLVCIVDVTKSSDQEALIARSLTFINNMNASLKEIDGCLRAAKSSYEMLKKTRDAMAESIAEHNMIGHVDDSVVEHDDTSRCSGTLTSGKRCTAPRLAGSVFCGRKHPLAAGGK